MVVFVPHIAASGGTLVSLTGNEIVMGMMSQLSPLDPQMDGVSALSVIRGFENVTNFFHNISIQDAPYTYKVLADKFDAESLDHAITVLDVMQKYVSEILQESGYTDEEIEKNSTKIVRGYSTHGDVITLDEAQKIGLKAVEYTKYQELWETYRMSLGKYLLQSADKHIIRYWVNKSNEFLENKREISSEELETGKEIKSQTRRSKKVKEEGKDVGAIK
ncbi:MAG: hypothetical protein JW931_00030 [Methanomicrobiaceae archaeon]|nr:hypothetical protein [Methanomicrobiaceae archaeon]